MCAVLIDANLGGQIFKKRVGIAGRGKSAGLRVLLAFQVGDRACFVFGFAKNERADVSDLELLSLKRLVAEFLGYDDEELAQALHVGKLYEVKKHE